MLVYIRYEYNDLKGNGNLLSNYTFRCKNKLDSYKAIDLALNDLSKSLAKKGYKLIDIISKNIIIEVEE